MATWSALQSKVYIYTNRPDLPAETLAALRRALRTCHQAGKFWRDLDLLTISGLDPNLTTQQYSLAGVPFRQAAFLRKRSVADYYLKPITIEELIDLDGYPSTDVYWATGTTLNIRAASPDTQYELQYYRWPDTSGAETVTSWVLDYHEDTVLCLAAATVLGITGEQEIKSRMDALATLGLKDLVEDSLEVHGR